MRTAIALTVVLLAAATGGVSANVFDHGSGGGNAQVYKRAHVRNQRAWGRRAVTDSATGTVATEVPATVTGDFTVSNTQAAAPSQTAAAVGADRGETSPMPSCESRAGFLASCDPVEQNCCEVGLTCMSKKCQRLCTLNTTEAYCDTENPCDTSLGYVCTSYRCRPPAGAIRVAVGETCDQGSGNTRFCIPAKGICANGTCQSCGQHT